MGLLGNLHEEASGGSLAQHHVDGLLAVDAVGDAQHQATGSQHVVGFRNVFADEIGHGDFAAVNGDAHGSDRAEKGRRRQDEHEQRHAAEPFESFANRHEDVSSQYSVISFQAKKTRPKTDRLQLKTAVPVKDTLLNTDH